MTTATPQPHVQTNERPRSQARRHTPTQAGTPPSPTSPPTTTTSPTLRSTRSYIDPEKLVAARARVGLAPHQAARRLGISRQRLSNWERGENHPRAAELIDLCRLYEIHDLADITSEVTAEVTD